MRPGRWAFDTIGRWLALNIVAAVTIAAGMNAAFVAFAGVWAKPGIEDIGLIDQAVAVARVVDASPPGWRPRLAASASSSAFRTTWLPTAGGLPVPIASTTSHSVGRKIRALMERPTAQVIAYEPGDLDVHGRPETSWGLAINLSDGSWLLFVPPERAWGLNRNTRNVLTGVFEVVCGLLVAAWASRRLARPMERFAQQAQRFGVDVNAPPVHVTGPLEIRLAGQAFNDMQARVQRYVADRTTMLAAISHDLRAPLTRMRLRGEFIEDEEQQRKLFRDVDEMQAMVDASLSFFRDDSDPEPPTRFNLTELVDTVLDDFRDAGSDVAFHTAGSIAYVGRPLTLRRAIANLVDNAVKYGSRAAVTLSADSEYVEMLVDDEGPGIPVPQREDVFRPFFRLESSRNRQTGGAGLGLSAVRSAVRGHGGEIELETRKSGGLRVRVRLPLVSDMPLDASHGTHDRLG
ncbi:HAMP domain-containing protein [Luteibacter pinisoli]|uniref:histidine kinase n=1 Tax=Luteibacter pinisoli TaxID=2589080 RepID=A0A4Y5YYT6_9GAMM|nr:ATP-binding protein [Luteibacter pinisoli]QDE37726.1 HAMP domain-containing protein [Luteibacter pinisoli]